MNNSKTFNELCNRLEASGHSITRFYDFEAIINELCMIIEEKFERKCMDFSCKRLPRKLDTGRYDE